MLNRCTIEIGILLSIIIIIHKIIKIINTNIKKKEH